jgi:hypothetical protein
MQDVFALYKIVAGITPSPTAAHLAAADVATPYGVVNFNDVFYLYRHLPPSSGF